MMLRGRYKHFILYYYTDKAMSGKPIGLPLIMVIASRYFTGILSIRA